MIKIFHMNGHSIVWVVLCYAALMFWETNLGISLCYSQIFVIASFLAADPVYTRDQRLWNFVFGSINALTKRASVPFDPYTCKSLSKLFRNVNLELVNCNNYTIQQSFNGTKDKIPQNGLKTFLVGGDWAEFLMSSLSLRRTVIIFIDLCLFYSFIFAYFRTIYLRTDALFHLRSGSWRT